MTSSLSFSRGIEPRRAAISRAAPAGLMLLAVFSQDPIAYLCIVVPVIAPFFLWMRAGGLGMPILPAISGLYFIYYAVPLFRDQMMFYRSEQLIEAGATVGAFLIAATLASWPFLSRAQIPRNDTQNFVSDRQVRLVFIGLVVGIVYYLALMSGSLNWLGSYFGPIRTVVFALTSIACYLLGCARGSRVLSGDQWKLALGGLILLFGLSLSNLFLVGGVMIILPAFLGYVITAKRIPWIGLAIACTTLGVLHAGKSEIRNAYWLPQSQALREVSVSQIPRVMTEWVTAGIYALWVGQPEADVLERASLLHMVLLVQAVTPQSLPYLEGETYSLLPSMLVPRFVEPDKMQSQAGLNLLSVRYGLQTVESSANTTIGWGLVAEAYANFGHFAVVPIGILLGIVCGTLTRISAAAAPLSLSMLVTIAAGIVLFNVEMDLSYLITTLAQTIAATLLFASLPTLWGRRRRGRAGSGEEALHLAELRSGETPRSL
jgi:hypothetical protein